MRFVDTNLLLYRVSGDPAEARKRRVAEEILRCDDLALSVQVFQEFYVQATRVGREGALRHEEALALVRSWKRYPVQEMTLELVEAAFAAKERWKISYWDAAIVEAARALGCEVLLSEDLNDGQDFDGVRVSNPFA